jgi:hypothetical protein
MKMDLIRATLLALPFFGGTCYIHAQNQSIAAGLGLYVFPSGNQDPETQGSDEMTCYSWAKEQSGVDPMNPPEVQAAQADHSMDGSAVKGAAGGAAAGAAVGAITGDAGDGAAIGAILGGIRGRRARTAREKQQQQANDVAAALTEQEYMNNFKKAFSACMEGKGYTVK